MLADPPQLLAYRCCFIVVVVVVSDVVVVGVFVAAAVAVFRSFVSSLVQPNGSPLSVLHSGACRGTRGPQIMIFNVQRCLWGPLGLRPTPLPARVPWHARASTKHAPQGWNNLSQNSKVCEALVLMTYWLWRLVRVR